MEILASYNDENNSENSLTYSPKNIPTKSSEAPTLLEYEWLSFEQMIAPAGVVDNAGPLKMSDFLVDSVVSYPGLMKNVPSLNQPDIVSLMQSSESSDSKTDQKNVDDDRGGVEDAKLEKSTEDDDDAFLRLRKKVKERDRSSSSESSSSSSSLSSPRSSSPDKGTPSPPHLSPINSVRSHASEPPNLIEPEMIEEKTQQVHQDQHSSRRHISHSRSRDRKHQDSSRERHRHKAKKSRDRKTSRGSKERSKSNERKFKKSYYDAKRKSKDKGTQRGDSKSESSDKKEVARAKNSKKDVKNEISRKNKNRSRSRERKVKKERMRSVSRNRHRGYSRDSKRSRSKEPKHSRSRDRKRSTSNERKRRSKSKDRRSRSRHRSKERCSRSQSCERLRSGSPVPGRKLTFKEQMRKEFINANKGMCSEKVEMVQELTIKRPGEPLRPCDLLKGVKLLGGDSVTPQMALMQTMVAMHKKAQELTGVEVPKYYNPVAVNPLKYAEQVQKRKLLWSKKAEEKDKNEQIETQWKSAFMTSEDRETASKFCKLMGIRNEERKAESVPEEMQKLSEEQQRKQQELFERLDQEYQFARMTTHTQRGVGLGFATAVIDPNIASHRTNQPCESSFKH